MKNYEQLIKDLQEVCEGPTVPGESWPMETLREARDAIIDLTRPLNIDYASLERRLVEHQGGLAEPDASEELFKGTPFGSGTVTGRLDATQKNDSGFPNGPEDTQFDKEDHAS